MNSPSPEATATQERCQYRTPAGRHCALHILDPRSSFCPRHASAQVPDSQDFSTLILKNAGDFDDPIEIKRALTSLFKLLASGRITSRRAKALAYIASLLLRTLRDSNAQAASQQLEIVVHPRHRFDPPRDDRPQGPASNDHLPEFSGTPISPSASPDSAAQATAARASGASHSTVGLSKPAAIPVSPSVNYGAPIHPYRPAPSHRSCPLPTRRSPHQSRAPAASAPSPSPHLGRLL